MLLEVDSSTLPHPRTPHLMCDARCPFCGHLMRLVNYYGEVDLAWCRSWRAEGSRAALTGA
jgi:hypothetical protein